jgi:uncharacterized SAM-binding protein YcdF (DUF218 family)
MITFLSKFLPLFIYPLGFVSLLLVLALLLWKKQRLAKTTIVIVFVILLLGGNRYVTSAVARSLEWRFPSPDLTLQADAIVILGGGTEPAISPRQSVEVNAAGDRVIYGAILARQFPQARVIVSGGDIDFLDIAPSTPAQDMASLLELMDISQDRIILQENSQNTYEDAQLTCKVISENGFSRVLLVTSAMHMPRSMMMFEKAGCTVIPAPTDYTITEAAWQHLWHPNIEEFFINLVPAYTNLSTLTKSLKEYFGIVYYTLLAYGK